MSDELPEQEHDRIAEPEVETIDAPVAADIPPKQPGRARTVLAIAASVVVLVLGAAWATLVIRDAYESSFVPAGVVFRDVELGGLDATEAGTAIGERLAELATEPLTLNVGDAMQTVQLGEVTSFDATAIATEALSVREQTPFVWRVLHDWSGEPIPREIMLPYSVDETAIDEYVAGLAKQYNTKAKNAKRYVEGYKIKIKDDVKGRSVLTTATADALSAAVKSLAEDEKPDVVVVQFKEKTAKTTTAKLSKKTALVVSLSKRRIYLYKGDKLVKTYACAIGTPSHPTPQGDFKIVLKRYMPTWSNPGSAWAADMPQTIAPGPSNPLGVRALNLNAPGIRIHGTTNIGSVGTAASHGCMRVANSQIVDLYDRVKVGDPVYIKR
ncbi:MAG: L,D-transpeptidase/peptidoglycan binding protein [Actinomycetes bacterium]|jgi:lipoprotein-anchoring transpeptidase ErfK/SrfK|nr:L,D-transpeptidase/peptidoglycan binding protein [Actinomycetes bacterium]